jgi:peroxiredoxin
MRAFVIKAVVILVTATALDNGRTTAADTPPAVGAEAKDFELPALGGGTVRLSKLTADGPVVLVVLRGYPGYQCPLCTRQFGEFLGQADAFRRAGAKVMFVYPGPADNLKGRASEFVRGKDIPDHFHVLLDPDYRFTNAYGLRWDARNETAYPSTFVLDRAQKVTFAKTSKTHGDRATAADALKAIPAR